MAVGNGATCAASLFVLCSAVSPAVAQTSWNQLPVVAQAKTSEAIGRAEAAYHAVPLPEGFRFDDSQSNLEAKFTRDGVTVTQGARSDWSFALEAYGDGSRLRALRSVRPRAIANRVEYRRGAVVEWYVNGPAGLEQGFTIAKAPESGADRSLTLAFEMSGTLKPEVDATHTGLTLRGRDGERVLRYAGLTAYDATGRRLTAWLELREHRLLVHVQADRALYPIVVDPYIQIAKLTIQPGLPGDNVGVSVAISEDGNTIAIGNTAGLGAVYVFEMPAGGWATTSNYAAILTASDRLQGSFGQSVSIDAFGKTIVAGAPDTNDHMGAAYVFVKPAGGWASGFESARLTASDADFTDFFGTSVGVNGDGSTVVVGAPKDPGSRVGAAYVFVEPSGGWANETESAELTPSDGVPSDRFGTAARVSQDGAVVVASSPFKDFEGVVYLFLKPNSGWTSANQTTRLTALNISGFLGWSLDLSAGGFHVVAGDPVNPGLGSVRGAGAVYVFEEPAAGWPSASNLTETAFLGASDAASNQFLGYSVSISPQGTQIVAGALNSCVDVPGCGPNGPGAAYVFARPDSGWVTSSESAKLTASDATTNDFFGAAVSASGNGSTLVIGAPRALNDSNQVTGAAYVFSGSAFPFAMFSVSGLQISTDCPCLVDLKSSFTLAASSNGIDPTGEAVRVQIGSLFLTIPAGSFHANKQGNYVFQGSIGAASIDAQFKVTGTNSYEFLFKVANAQLNNTGGPLAVALSIGDDGGSIVK